MKNYLQKAYAFSGTVRIYAAITTELVQHAQKIHNLWPTSCAALGRCLTIASIMSCTYKSQEHLTIKVCGDGPIGNITLEATDGKVRGFVQNPGVYLSFQNGKLAVGDAVGRNGYIEVIKDLHMRAPFSSSSALVSGEIAEDFTYYFAQSEQIPSSVGLGVLIDPDGKVISSGGFLVQIMPGCKEETLLKLEEHLKNMKSCSTMINEGYTAEEIIAEISDNDYQLLETRELYYDCPCSKDRFRRGLISLGIQELTTLLHEDHKAHITCNFCKKEYIFSEQDLSEMIEELNKEA